MPSIFAASLRHQRVFSRASAIAVLEPLVTEKGTHQFTRHNAYPFRVNLWSTKDQIRAAVQELFNVRVVKVRTQTRQGKQRRYRFRLGRMSSWKKAIVTLHQEDRIEFF